ncbi:gephyrin-like molybdotransferase Glp [Xanthomonas sp. 1678]|uniref:molybdopterin molybdotransferase MoeA n=1 Tax=Xanthomonas sp. 1678 TaxID=3158788 RepID=UPI00285E7FC1|nr:molybdopterin molybdotransferase [Xanthomonas translucens]
MIGYAQALSMVREAVPLLGMEAVPAIAAEDRVLAEPLVSAAALPPFDNSAMDGFGVHASSAGLAAGVELAVGGWQAAGDTQCRAGDGAWEMMTGAPVPAGLDAVIPVEQVEVLARAEGRPLAIRLLAAVQPGQHVRRSGEDVCVGEPVLPAGERLGAPQTTMLAALGVAQVLVRRRPRVAVIATGRELVGDPAQPLASGQIRDSNRPFLAAQLRAAGAEVVWQGIVGDEPAQFHAALDAALAAGADAVLSSGAVSQGRYDFVPEALRQRGARIGFHKVAIRPGKPLLFATLAEGPLYFGLPGNPVSSAVGLRFFVEPALRAMLGLAAEKPLWLPAGMPIAKPAALRFHGSGVVACDRSGQLRAAILPQQHSFRLRPLLAANAWLVVPEGVADVAADEPVQVYGLGHWQPVQLSWEKQS